MSLYLTAYSTTAHMITEVIIYDGKEFCLLREGDGWNIPEDKNRRGDKSFLSDALMLRGFKLFEHKRMPNWFSEPLELENIRGFEREQLKFLTFYNDLTYASEKFPELEDVEEPYFTSAYLDLLNACEVFFDQKERQKEIWQELSKLLDWKFISLFDQVSKYLSYGVPIRLKYGEEAGRRKIVENVGRTLDLIDEIKRKRDGFSIATRLSRQMVAADTVSLLNDKREWLKQAEEFIRSIGLGENENTEENIKSVIEQKAKRIPIFHHYSWYTFIGDINRLLFKVAIINVEFYFKNAYCAYNLAKEEAKKEGKGIHLVLSRLSDALVGYCKWLSNKDPSRMQIQAKNLIEICEEWLKLPTNHYIPYVRLGDAYLYKGDSETSKEWYKKAIELKPLDPPAYMALCNILLEEGDVLGAVKKLDEFWGHVLQSQYPEKQRSADWIEFLCANWLYEAGFSELCLDRLIRILTETQSRNLEAGRLLVRVFSENPSEEIRKKILDKIRVMGSLTTAQAYVVSSLLGLPDIWGEQKFSNCHEYLAQYYFEMAKKELPDSDNWNNYIEAAVKYNQFLQGRDLEKKDIVIWDRLGRIYLLKGEIKKAKELFEELQNIPRYSEDAYIPFRLAQCLMKEGNYEKAIEFLMKAYDKERRIETLDNIGFCYIMSNKHNEAEPYFKKILAESPSDPLALYHLGAIQFEHEEYAEAATKWIESLESKVQVSEELEGRYLDEAIRTTDALLSCLKHNPLLWSNIFERLKSDSRLTEILIDRLATLSIFDSKVANDILKYYKDLRWNKLKRRIMQYCMGRSIFLMHGLISNEPLSEWIRKVLTIVSVREANFRSEFLAGAKSSYRRALREIAAFETVPDHVKIVMKEILNFSDTNILNKGAKIYAHICSTVNEAGYYRTTENLFEQANFTDDEFITYAQLQIKGFAKKMIQSDHEAEESLKALCDGISEADAIEESMNLLAICPRVSMPWGLGNFIEQIKSRGGNAQFYTNSGRKQEDIKNISIWIDDAAVEKLLLWCLIHSNKAEQCNYSITKGGSLRFTFPTRFTWTESTRFNTYLQRNAIIKFPDGFELIESVASDIGVIAF